MRAEQTAGRGTGNGFTRLELVVLLATLALLVTVMRPVWGSAGATRSVVCMDNLRRLGSAWLLYAEDSGGNLAGNYHGGFLPVPGTTSRPWASGWLDWTTSGNNTNTAYLTDPRYAALAPFLAGDTTLFKCPADEYLSPPQYARGWTARARSYVVNCYVGEGNQATGPFDPSYPIVKRLGDFKSLPPQRIFVFTEEHPDSINDPLLFVNMSTWLWTDLPGSFHEGACWFTFADGHLEQRAWESSSTLLPVRFNYANNAPLRTGDPDLSWLRARTAAR